MVKGTVWTILRSILPAATSAAPRSPSAGSVPRSIAANFKPHNKKRRKLLSCAFRSNARLYILLLTHDHNRALACAGACAVEVDEVAVTRGADGELAVGNLEGLR